MCPGGRFIFICLLTSFFFQGQAKLAYDNNAQKVYMVLDTFTDGKFTKHVKYLQDFKQVNFFIKSSGQHWPTWHMASK